MTRPGPRGASADGPTVGPRLELSGVAIMGNMGSDRQTPRHHFALLDSIRGLAAIAILVIHVAIFSGGLEPWYGRFVAHLDIGVPFFFLLSAFLLYRPFVHARVTGVDRPSLRAYGWRRFIRIAPAYWVALTVAALLPGMAGALSGNWWVYYGLLQNYPIYSPDGICATDPFRCGIPPAWSLALEVAFYATLPLLVLAMAKWGSNRPNGRWLPRELMVLGGAAAISVSIQSSIPTTDLDVWLFFSPLGRAWWFGLGLALAAVSVWLELRRQEPRAVGWLRAHGNYAPLIGAGLYILAALFLLEPGPSLGFPLVAPSLYVSEYLLAGVIALLFLLPATVGSDGGGIYRTALAHPVLTWLGRISYGVFLWQFPVLITLLDADLVSVWPDQGFQLLLVSTFAGTVACATISYYLIERPLLRRFRSPRRSGQRRASEAPDLASPPMSGGS